MTLSEWEKADNAVVEQEEGEVTENGSGPRLGVPEKRLGGGGAWGSSRSTLNTDLATSSPTQSPFPTMPISAGSGNTTPTIHHTSILLSSSPSKKTRTTASGKAILTHMPSMGWSRVPLRAEINSQRTERHLSTPQPLSGRNQDIHPLGMRRTGEDGLADDADKCKAIAEEYKERRGLAVREAARNWKIGGGTAAKGVAFYYATEVSPYPANFCPPI